MKPRACKKSVDYGDFLLAMVLFGLFVMVAGLMAAAMH
jgi:hypothetical protein